MALGQERVALWVRKGGVRARKGGVRARKDGVRAKKGWRVGQERVALG